MASLRSRHYHSSRQQQQQQQPHQRTSKQQLPDRNSNSSSTTHSHRNYNTFAATAAHETSSESHRNSNSSNSNSNNTHEKRPLPFISVSLLASYFTNANANTNAKAPATDMSKTEALLPPNDRDLEAGEGSPLVDGVRASNNGATGTSPLEAVIPAEDRPLEPIPEGASIKEKAVAGAAFVAFTMNLLSMLLNIINPFALVSGFLGVGLAPFAAFQQQKLTQTQALAETNQRFSEEVDQLKDENVRLRKTLEELESSLKSLKKSKDTLKQLQAVQGVTLDELEHQLQESKDIFASMKQNLQGDILQNLISMVLACDDDGDMILSDDEIDDLIFNLEGVHGVQLKEELIRKMIVDNGRSLNAIMDVAKTVLTGEDGGQANAGLFQFLEAES